MKIAGRLGVLSGALLAVLMVACMATRRNPLGPANFSARTIDVQLGGVAEGLSSATNSGAVQGTDLFLVLSNETKEDLWVVVTFNGPGGTMLGTCIERLPRGEPTLYSTPIVSIRNDADYPVLIRVYRDPTLDELLESAEMQFRFSQEDCDAFEKLQRSLAAGS